MTKRTEFQEQYDIDPRSAEYAAFRDMANAWDKAGRPARPSLSRRGGRDGYSEADLAWLARFDARAKAEGEARRAMMRGRAQAMADYLDRIIAETTFSDSRALAEELRDVVAGRREYAAATWRRREVAEELWRVRRRHNSEVYDRVTRAMREAALKEVAASDLSELVRQTALAAPSASAELQIADRETEFADKMRAVARYDTGFGLGGGYSIPR